MLTVINRQNGGRKEGEEPHEGVKNPQIVLEHLRW